MKKRACILTVIYCVCLLVMSPAEALAWGPQRDTFTNKKPADHAVFNSITDNAAVGDERDFVRIEERNSNRPYSSEILVEPGKDYDIYIYYHNDASSTYNDAEHEYIGVARDVRLLSYFPQQLSKGERQAVVGTIMAGNTDPESVWDEAYITATEDITLHYIEGSAKIYNLWEVNENVLSTSLFSQDGVLLGLDELNGVIPGCDEYSGSVVYSIRTVAAQASDGSQISTNVAQEEEKSQESSDGNNYKSIIIIMGVLLIACAVFIIFLLYKIKH